MNWPDLYRRLRTGTALAALGMGTLALARPFMRINGTDSMPKGLYFVMTGPQAPTRGNLAVLCLPPDWTDFAADRGYLGHGECAGDHSSLLKPILAVPGDSLQVTADGVWINGKPVPNSAALGKDSAGRTLMSYPFGSYAVEPGTVWVFSSHDRRSFDSRYFGPIPDSLIVGSAFPLLTF